MDWRAFVETMSVVEQTLRRDSGGGYGKMDFSTRDRYRYAVEKTTKKSPLSENEVAQIALQLAHEGAVAEGVDDRKAHVGFYLIDRGMARLEKMAA